jgi:hypothetical protein
MCGFKSDPQDLWMSVTVHNPGELTYNPFSRNFGNKACAGSLVGPQLIFGRLLDMIDDDYVIGELCRSHL